MRRHLALGAALVTSAGCSGDGPGPRDQWEVVITTNASTPQFGDRVLVEVLDDRGEIACEACRRQLGVPEIWPLSFGVVPPAPASAVRLRVRLYRATYAGADGGPRGESVIDLLSTLPEAHGVTKVHAFLSMDCFGVPSDVARAETCDPRTSRLGPEPVLESPPEDLPEPGTWQPGLQVPCGGPTPPGAACIAGGAFLMGAPAAFIAGDESAPWPERLVRLSPYALDVDEVTVGQVRALVLAGLGREPVWRDVSGKAALCTYLGPSDATNDALPVNCVDQFDAEAVCAALGKRLPTEAEWEFAAGNRARETRFPWGDSQDYCTVSVLGRGRGPLLEEEDYCIGRGADVVGPVAGGLDADVTDQGIRNLGGNLSEWVADRFAPYATACWQGLLLEDPRCDVAVPPPDIPTLDQAFRGGSYASLALAAHAYQRNGGSRTGSAPNVGFRCARSMNPGG